MSKEKRVHWYDGQEFHYDDLVVDQSYLTNKSENLAEELLEKGVVNETLLIGKESLTVTNEQPAFYQTRDDATITIAVGDTALYAHKFATLATNIQMVTVRLQATAGWTGVVEVAVYALQDSTDIGSSINTSDILGTVTLTGAEIPTTKQDVTIDFSYSSTNEISEGSVLVVGSYYAIGVRRIGGLGGNVYLSYSQTRGSSASYGVKASGGEYNLSGGSLTKQEALYFKIYSAAVSVSTGLAYVDGRRVVVEGSDIARSNISVVNFTAGASNYLLIEAVRSNTDIELHPRTKSLVYSREEDTYTLVVVNPIEWANYDRSNILLLAEFTRATYTRTKIATIEASELLTITDQRTFIPFVKKGVVLDLVPGEVYEDFGYGTASAAEANDAAMVVREGGVTGVRKLDTSGSYTGTNVIGIIRRVILDTNNNATKYCIVAHGGITTAKAETYTSPTEGSQAIQVGDLLIPSTLYSGRVCKEGNPDHRYVLGKSLSPLAIDSLGVINVLITV